MLLRVGMKARATVISISLVLAALSWIGCDRKPNPNSSAESHFGNPVQLVSPDQGQLTGIAYGAGRFCAVGTQGLVFVAEDGKKWRQVRNAIQEDLRQVFYHKTWDDTGASFGSFVAVGASGALYGDQGKDAWKILSPSREGRFLRLYHPTGKCSGALLDSGVLLHASPSNEENTESWSRTYMRTNVTLEAACSGGGPLGSFVAVGPRGTIVSLADSEIVLYNFAFALRETPTRVDLHGVAWAGDKFVAVGDSGIVLSSADGEHWEKESSGITGAIRGVASGIGMCIAVTENGILARKALSVADPDTLPDQDPLALGLWLSPDSIAFQVGWMDAKQDTSRVSLLVSPRADNWDTKLPKLPPWGDRLKDFIPYGWNIFSLDSGDLNQDHSQDYAFIIEGDETGLRDSMPWNEPFDWTGHRILAVVLGMGSGHEGGKGYRLIQQCDTCIIPQYDQRMGQDIYDEGGPFISNDTLTIQSHGVSMGGWEDYFQSYHFKYMGGTLRLVAGVRSSSHRTTGEYEKRSMDFLTGVLREEKGSEGSDIPVAPTFTLDTLPISEIRSFENMKEEW